MAYSVQPIILQNLGSGLTYAGPVAGFPATFDNLLFSMWVCLGAQPRAVAVANSVSFMLVDCNQSFVRVRLLRGLSLPVFEGFFNAPIDNVLSHFLVSVNLPTQTIQVYHNDLSLTQTDGPGWSGSGSFNPSPSPTYNNWNIGGAGSAAPGPGIADLFIGVPATFFDLTLAANRRKFINSNLTPVDLGTDASSVLGASPPMYLTVRPGGVANDFGNNDGTGEAFTISVPPLAFQAAGTCVVAAPPVIPKLAMDDVVCTIEPDLEQNLISLRWSDNRGHSYGSPVSKNIGAVGQYRTSLQWLRLGYARDRMFEVSWSVPMPTALKGCWFDAAPGQS